MRTEYLELQSVIKNGSSITDVEFKKNRLYFRVDGHLFSTFSNYAHHEKNPLFDHPILDYQSKKNNTPEGIEEEEKSNQDINARMELWDKYKLEIYKTVFLRALDILVNEAGEEAFINYIDHHFDIMENDENCQALIELIQKSK